MKPLITSGYDLTITLYAKYLYGDNCFEYSPHGFDEEQRVMTEVPISTNCLYYLISRATLVATGAMRRGFAEAGVENVSPAYLGVLISLWREDGVQAAELGRRAGLEPSSMTGLLDRMERDDLIRRQADPNDRRAQRIHLTSHGKAARDPALAVVEKVLGKVTRGVAEEDLALTKATLQKLLDNVQKERHPEQTRKP